VLCYLLLCTLTKERVREDKTQKQKFDYKLVMKSVLKNRPLIGVMVATIGSMLTITGGSMTYNYVYKEFYQNTDMITMSMAASMPLMIVLFPMVPKLVKKFGKRNVILGTSLFSFVICLARMFFVIENAWVYTILNMLTMVGQVPFTMLIWALVSDCLDYAEWKTGLRSDGSMYSLYTFSRKIGSTIASSGIAALIGMVGYVSGENVVQSAETVMGIYYVCNAVPLACYTLCLIGIGLIFNMDKKTTDQMYLEMAQRRGAEEN